jgi:uncharacterized protein (DUF2126 family)/transglutaminase-like putative cysteine protease
MYPAGMPLHVALHHETRYRYDRPVAVGPQVVRLRPAPHCRTPILGYSLQISPEEHFLNWQQDPQGNFLARAVFPEPTDHLDVTVDLVAEMAVINPFDFFLEEGAEQHPFGYEPWLRRELEPFLHTPPLGPRLAELVAPFRDRRIGIVDFLVELNGTIHRAVEYVVRMEPGVQTPEETLRLGRGSCRDSGLLAVAALRELGIAARFASGYLIQLAPDVESLDGPSGPKEDFTDLHAWAEAYLPGAGWVGLDPTSGLLAGEGHIPLACSPDPQSAAPITGRVEPCEVDFGHAMSVTRVLESARVTKPYTEGQWQRIERLGEAVDRRLVEGDVRLTMGGEPTFVSIDDMEGAEWNTDAMGPTKRRLADDLVRRLRDRFAPGGVLHYGQGKWYPGEPLPRWSFRLIWRTDGAPLWHDPSRIAREAHRHAPEVEDAGRFARGVARRLGVSTACVQPVYEDPIAALEAESALPENLDPHDHDLDDPAERARLVKMLSHGLGTPTAVVLPVQPWNARDGARRWVAERWSTRRGRLFLIPGDSPAGFRLPLGSLPSIPSIDHPHVVAADPTVRRPPLARPSPMIQPFLRSGVAPAADDADEAPASERPVRMAMAFEPRDGRLCVFLPPVPTADDFVELVATVEDTAAELGVPVHLEGYPPPPDARLSSIQVTPDPGVIEVNVHPSRDWKELRDVTTGLYEDARASRLGTEKFMLDGRHTGTGGGNHVVLGAAHPADSPFLRRPDLLASLLRHWINHPSLSYLFSGLFIGPTSQAPRVDEARQDSIYELGIALDRVPEPDAGDVPPWQVDRIFRDLLVDVTGNTHRAEFCIDKLYSPDSATGRLGLVELRAFEMPPHARMSLAQQLLVRALVARFWEHPCADPLVRFGTAVHDRFMLPHYVWADFRVVLEDLERAGFPFEPGWFAPHFEFRFPRYGSVRFRDVEIELRGALEPWHVLGEEGVAGATARYVDSSLERLQVRVTGLDPEHQTVTCNGTRLPLQSTGTFGEYVAGVRFRAWQPARCLHPTLPVDAPLTFDLVDLADGRALAGCRYHVAHPGGRSYDTFPVNGYEAEARRLARFFAFGHTPGPHPLAEAPVDRDFPTTLDLRRCGATGVRA